MPSQPVPVACSECRGSFLKDPYDIKRSKTGQHFCSYGCHQASQRTQVDVCCPICDDSFRVKPYRLQLRPVLYCSRACKAVGLGGGSTVVYCEWCGEDFRRKNAEIKPHNFCSRSCMGAWQSAFIKGEMSPSWRGGYKTYYGADWKANRRAARERDACTCQACGLVEDDTGRSLEVHHIKPVRLFEVVNDANDLANLVTLCRACHIKADVLARWFFDPDAIQALSFHPLQNDVRIARIYFAPETATI
jgi:hypothetical protein